MVLLGVLLAGASSRVRFFSPWLGEEPAWLKNHFRRSRCAANMAWLFMNLGVPEETAPFRARLRFERNRLLRAASALAVIFALASPGFAQRSDGLGKRGAALQPCDDHMDHGRRQQGRVCYL